jgi:putative MATE family efflux protein
MKESLSLTTGSITHHVKKLTIPVSIGFFFHTMYNVVDALYAGQLGTLALAAMALSFPVFFLIIATSDGLSKGVSALLANAIGAQDNSQQRSYITQGLSLGVITSVFLTILGLVIAEPLFEILGASGEYLQYALDYTIPIFWGSLFFITSSMANAILLANGDSKTFGKVLVAGFFLNLILDPWFLYGGFGLPALGITGIAWATVLIQALGSLYMLAVVIKRGFITPQCCRHLIPNLKVYGKILQQGLPASFNMISVALGFFVITYFLKFYGEEVVAAFGITTRIEQIALLPAIGLNAAVMALVGQNNGAKKYDRIQETMRICIRIGLVLIFTASAFIYLFAEPLMRIFTGDPEVITVGIKYIHIMAFIQWAYVMTFLHLSFLQAIKRPLYGLWESLFRKIILPFPIFYIIVHVALYPVEDIWFSIVAINVTMAIFTIIYAQRVLRKLR